MVRRFVLFTMTVGYACTLLADQPHEKIRTEAFFTPTIGILGTSPNPSLDGQVVTVRATANFGVPLTLYENGTPIAGASADANGFYTFTYAFSGVGSHHIVAKSEGTELFYPSESSRSHNVVIESINTTVTLTSAPNPSPAGSPVLLTATVSPNPGGGSVSFYAGHIFLGATPPSGGQATLLTLLPLPSPQSLTAYYSGFGEHSSSFSPFVIHVATGIDDVPTLDPRGLAALCALVGIAAVLALRR